jgi:uncharacterized SAM-binding protein YcdF (DUF218 family)
MNKIVLAAAQVLWNYHQLHHQLKKSDCILALGSHDLRVAERAAELYLQGYSPLLIMSGGLGNFTREIWTESEAEKFAQIAIRKGVPQESILIENKSTNTGENIRFTRNLLERWEIAVHNTILVQKPYMERRSYATIKKQWPEVEVWVTSPQIPLGDYPNKEIPLEKVINIMVGDLQRIIEYPALGFQIAQEVPDDVMKSYFLLISEGFNKHLMR